MFTTPRPNLFESSDGFSVEVLGRTGLRYREGNRTLFVDSEVLSGAAGIAVYRDTIARWEAPHDADTVDQADRERILNNIREAFRFQGFEIQVI
jgi:hypothetical protein